MTREELLQQLDGIVPKNPKSEWSKYQRKIVNEAIKAFEQEPILDRVRAEILEKCFNVPYKNQAFSYGLNVVKWSDVREILDKYKAESEGKK